MKCLCAIYNECPLHSAAPLMLEALEQAETSLTAVAGYSVQEMMRADAVKVLGYIRRAIKAAAEPKAGKVEDGSDV